MKILFVLEHYHPYIGGAETLFQLLAEALADRGHAITVVTTRFKPDLVNEEVVNGVNVVRVDCHNRFLFTVLSLPAIWRLAKEADFIHTTTYNAAPPAWLVGKLRGKRLVLTFHEVWGKLWFKLPFISRLAALAYFSFEQLVRRLPFDHYVAVSRFTQRALLDAGIPARKVVQVYNGLDYEPFLDHPHRPPADFTATYFGRLGISKGLNLLIPAFAAFARSNPEARLQLILPKRPAGMFQQINDLIDQSGARPFVRMLHELPGPELRRVISESSCVVVPSYSEGFCFVAAEAVAMGVPIISSAQGALQETVSGRFLEMEEMTPEAVVECLEKAKAGAWKERPVRRFTLEEAVEAYVSCYKAWSRDGDWR